MREIKFSHYYDKLGYIGDTESERYYLLPKKGEYLLLTFYKYCDTVWLVGVSKIRLEDLPKAFIQYDTRYYVGEVGRSEPMEYVFTTIRRWTSQKEKYYTSKIGEAFEVVLTEYR